MRSKLERVGKRRKLLLVLSLPMLLTLLFAVRQSTRAAQRETIRQFRPVRVIPAQRAIKNAPVIEANQVRGQVTDTELVLGVVIQGKARAYPINMLTGPSREIINDTLGGQAIAATW